MSRGLDKVSIELSTHELTLLVEALNSHVYWQLSDEQYRSDGAVNDPGAEDPSTQQEISDARVLEERLQRRLSQMLEADGAPQCT